MKISSDQSVKVFVPVHKFASEKVKNFRWFFTEKRIISSYSEKNKFKMGENIFN